MPRPGRRQKSTNVRFKVQAAFVRGLALVSPKGAARLLERAFLATRRHPLPERERSWLEGGSPVRFESRGRSLSAWTWGTPGPSVLLAHGWEGRGAQMGAFVAPLRAAGFHVVTFDQPGHGVSSGGRSSLIEMADAIQDASLRFGPFQGIVAHSAGAAATTLALHRGARARGLVYIAPPSDLEEFFDRLAARLELPAPVVSLAKERIERRLGFQWEDIRHEELAGSMSVPLLILHDSEDREIGIENGERLASAWPGSRLEPTRGLGHRRVLRDEAVVSRAVSFLMSQREELGSGRAELVPALVVPPAELAVPGRNG
jgi:pimeloyl-ACP methyl ester carboxylesterase